MMKYFYVRQSQWNPDAWTVYQGPESGWECQPVSEPFAKKEDADNLAKTMTSKMINTYQNQLQEYLQASSLTPGMYTPSTTAKSIEHVAVCVGGKPVLLTGPSDDKESLEQAKAFCSSLAFGAATKALGLKGSPSVVFLSGEVIDWLENCEAVVKSEPGIIEAGNEDGDLMTINLSQNRGLTTLLCINTELAQIIDPNAPEMCDGQIVPTLAKQSESALEFH